VSLNPEEPAFDVKLGVKQLSQFELSVSALKLLSIYSPAGQLKQLLAA
jgi:hypothetical protein